MVHPDTLPWTEQDEQDAAEMIQYMLRTSYANEIYGRSIKNVIRAQDGKRWLAVNDHETFDITDAIQHNARMIVWHERHQKPIGS